MGEHTEPARPRTRSFTFGPFVLFPERQLLLEGARAVRIGCRAMDILTALVERSGELVSKNELIARAWPDTVVDESNLKVNMVALRRTLGEGSNDGRYIATVTGRGYRFIAKVTMAYCEDLEATASRSTVRRHNLPIGTTRILGRAGAIEAIRSDLDASRMVTIVGPGGIGKTTVALAVADAALGAFEHGVWLVDFALLKDSSLAPNAIATAMGLAAGTPNVPAALRDFLRDRELLLVFDSCEHIIDAAASCASRILTDAVRVKILATSREPLMVNGERVRNLPALETPASSAELSAREALAYPAVALFVERATDRLESFKLSDADAPTASEICRRLDGLALAIELASTRLEAFGVGGLLKQLDDGLLLVGRRAGPERHRTLAAVLDWSYGLLPPEEAALLRAVGVFAGVFDVDAVSAVAGLTPAEASHRLAQLATKSLMVTDLSAPHTSYRLLETTRAYCLELLLASGDADSTRLRHAEYVCQVLERGASEWPQRSAEEWEASYGRMLDDLRVALAWAEGDLATRAIAVRLTVAGLLLWNHFSLLEECRVHVSKAVEDLDAAGAAGTAWEMHLQLWLGGVTMFTRGLTPLAMSSTRRALVLASEFGELETQLRCLRTIGLFQHLNGEHASGLYTFETLASLCAASQSPPPPDGEAHVCISEFFVGRLSSARLRLERLRAGAIKDARMRQTLRYQSDISCVIGCVSAVVEWVTGSPDSAARLAESTMAYALETRHHLSLNDAIASSCPVFYWSGRYDDCARTIAMLDDLGARHGLATRRPIAMFFHVMLTLAKDAPSDAVEALERAIAAFRAIRHMARMPYYLCVFADTLARAGELRRAEATIDEALELVHAQSEGWCGPEVLRVRGSIWAARGETARAEVTYRRSIALANQSGALSWRLRAATDLAALLSAQYRTDEAYELLKPIYDEFTEGFQTPDLATAGALLGALERARDEG